MATLQLHLQQSIPFNKNHVTPPSHHVPSIKKYITACSFVMILLLCFCFFFNLKNDYSVYFIYLFIFEIYVIFIYNIYYFYL